MRGTEASGAHTAGPELTDPADLAAQRAGLQHLVDAQRTRQVGNRPAGL
ncbi:hypothetical protein [Microbispora sp. NBRC 16548]|nr:hypothetical protein [Microbispora sp. NBRC 16548]